MRLRAASNISVVGGDVGTEEAAHIRKQDVVGRAHQEAGRQVKGKKKGIVMQTVT